MIKNISIGIVADWFVTYAGSEKVVAEFLKVFPDSDLYAVVDFLSAENKTRFNNKPIQTTFIQNLPKAKNIIKNIFP